MTDYARQQAQRDAELNRQARVMSNATAQEREKYHAALEAERRRLANK